MGRASRRKKEKRQGRPSRDVYEEKASTRLIALVSPHRTPHETRDSYAALITLGAMAWNLSLMPVDERLAQVRDTVTRAEETGLPLTVEWMNALIERKLRLFPDDDRFIQSFDVVPTPDGRFTVLVAALS